MARDLDEHRCVDVAAGKDGASGAVAFHFPREKRRDRGGSGSLDDEDESPTEDEIEECLAAYQRVVSAAEADLEELNFDADSIAYQIAARVDFGTEVKQGLLELRSERERVLRLAPMLDQAAEAVQRDREIRERASGNGRVEPV